MTSLVDSYSATDLASILDEDPPFIALLVLESADEAFINDLGYAFGPVCLMLTVPCESVRSLVAEMAQSTPRLYCLANLNEFTSMQFKELDIARSQFVADRVILLVLNERATNRFLAHAPNLRSFIGAKVFGALPDVWTLTAEQRDERLENLRTSLNMTDDELVRRVTHSEIDLRPWVVDWLILLDRGDLIP